jgi:esterase/lipase superfamily enzyme
MKIMVILSSFFLATSAMAKLKFSSDYPLYLSDESRYSYAQVETALDRAFSYKKPVLLFVHGRGNEPEKSLNGGTFVEGNAVHKLEQQYGVKVVMFNWESSAFLYDREKPLKRMPASAASFKKVLAKVNTYMKANKDKKLTLLAHSMGSIVLQNYIQTYGWEYKTKIFSSVLFTSPDADNKNHSVWLDKVAQVEKVYVTINKDDDILEKSTDARAKGVLALGLNPVKPFSAKVTYLDMTKMGTSVGAETGQHEVFNKEGMKDQKNVCDILDALITSTTPNVTSATVTTSIAGYLNFKYKRDDNASCFK